MKVSIIAALSNNGVIGKGGRLPWHIPEDLAWFKRHTSSHPVIMGRKTYESIGRRLSGRDNIVITKQKNYTAPGSRTFDSLQEALKTLKECSYDEVFIIGGEQIYRQALELADRLYLTMIHEDFDGDAFFPPLPEGRFSTVFEERHGGPIPFTFLILEKKT